MFRLPQITPKIKRPQESGQALLIVLLAMSVILTVVLSAVSRSVTDISVTSYEENALRAFSAAEAGIEQVLLSEGSTGASGTFTGDVSFNASVTTPSGFTQFAYPGDISSGESVTFWFVSHGSSGNLTCSGKPCLRSHRVEVCWGKTGTPNNQGYTPAIEVSVFYDPSPGRVAVNGGNYSFVEAARAVYDPYNARTSSNHFKYTSSTCSFGSNYRFSTGRIGFQSGQELPISCYNSTGCLLIAKVRMFYNDPLLYPAASPQPVSIRVWPQGSTSLPAQGFEISSTGIAAESTRRINVFQAYPEPPYLFDTAVFSLKDITK